MKKKLEKDKDKKELVKKIPDNFREKLRRALEYNPAVDEQQKAKKKKAKSHLKTQ